jgi:hypothetical protein
MCLFTCRDAPQEIPDDVTHVYDDVTHVYDDVTHVYDDVTHVYDDVTYVSLHMQRRTTRDPGRSLAGIEQFQGSMIDDVTLMM